MGAISAGDQTLLRNRTATQSRRERLYLWGMVPIWTGRVNDASIARGALSIVYDTGALESGFVFGDIRADFVVWFGSSSLSDDRGRRRLISITGTETAGTIVVDWHDDMALSNDDYITITLGVEPMPRYSWFEVATPDFRKDGPASDGGIDYSTQNDTLNPHVICTGDYAGELPASGSLQVQLAANESRVPTTGAAALDGLFFVSWFAIPSAGCSFSSSSSSVPILTITTEGKRLIGVTVTATSGKTATSYRRYIVGGGIDDFKWGGVTESYDRDSLDTEITLTSPDATNALAIRPTIDYSQLIDGCFVMIAADDEYGTTQKTVTFRGGNYYTDHRRVIYRGYVIAEQRHFSGGQGLGEIRLKASSSIGMYLHSLSLTGVPDPTDWYEFLNSNMSIASLAFHLLYWHSTILQETNVRLPFADTVLRSAVEEWSEGNLVERLRSLVGPHGRLMAITATSAGEIWIEADANLLNQTGRDALTTTLTLNQIDMSGAQVDVDIRPVPTVGQVFLDGGSSSGVLGSFTPYLSESLYVRKARGLELLQFERLMLPDQTEANRLCGRLAAVANRRVYEARIVFTGNYHEVFSPADQQWVNSGTVFSDMALANLRGGDDLDNLRMVPREVTKGPANEQGYVTTEVVFEFEAPDGLDGRTVDYFKPRPGYTPSSTEKKPPIMYDPLDVVVTGDNTNGFEVYDPWATTWGARNSGLAATVIYALKVIPFWWYYQQSSDPEDAMVWIGGDGILYLSKSLGKTWASRRPLSLAGGTITAANADYTAIDSPALADQVGLIVVAQARGQATGVWHSWNLISTNAGYDWTSVKVAPASAETRLLDLRIDQTTGAQLYEARQDIDAGNLYVRQLDTALAEIASTEEDFGAATEAEIDARTYKLALYVPDDPAITGAPDVCIAYGRMTKT